MRAVRGHLEASMTAKTNSVPFEDRLRSVTAEVNKWRRKPITYANVIEAEKRVALTGILSTDANLKLFRLVKTWRTLLGRSKKLYRLEHQCTHVDVDKGSTLTAKLKNLVNKNAFLSIGCLHHPLKFFTISTSQIFLLKILDFQPMNSNNCVWKIKGFAFAKFHHMLEIRLSYKNDKELYLYW